MRTYIGELIDAALKPSARAEARLASSIVVLLIVWTVIHLALIANSRYVLPLTFYEVTFVSVSLWNLAGRGRAARELRRVVAE